MTDLTTNCAPISGPAPKLGFYDTETNGLLPTLTKLHSLGLRLSDGRKFSCAEQPGYEGQTDEAGFIRGRIIHGIMELERCEVRVAHNGQEFDDPAIKKVYPWYKPKGKLIDTLLLSRLLFPDIRRDGPNNFRLPPALRGSHSLKAWGIRLGDHKGDFDAGDWQTWSSEMQDYMDQDCVVLEKLFKYLMSLKPSVESVSNEHDFAAVIRRMERRGFTFDHPKALQLQATLQKRERQLETELIKYFGEWWEPKPVVTIKATRELARREFPDVTVKRYGKNGKELKPYVGPPMDLHEAGAKYTPISRVQFNPGSRDHVRLMLQQRYGWKPTEKTDTGLPKVDDDVLRALPYPEAKKIADYYVVQKRLGALAKGQVSWLKLAVLEGKEWRIHGRVNTNGAGTHRCTHSGPNVTQVPTAHDDTPYGKECRSLWIPRVGYRLVGHDGSGLELRMLAHYVAAFDGGEYAHIVDAEDPHAWVRDTIGTDLMGEGDDGRNKAKTSMYAYLYGAGNLKIGRIIAPLASPKEQMRIGGEFKLKLNARFHALGELTKALLNRVAERGHLVGLDGRIIRIRKPHATLNSLLQCAGAVVMKKSLIVLDNELQRSLRWTPGREYEFVANVHDEAQTEVLPECVEAYIPKAEWSVPEAGLQLKFKCPLKAVAKAGSSWAATH